MTSNMGSALIRENFEKITAQNHDEVVEDTKNAVLNMLKQNIRPEFLNRIDDIIMFAPLKRDEITQIVRIQLDIVKKMLAENGLALEYTEAAVESLSAAGYDPEFGARPVKRVIQRMVLNQLSKDILASKVDNSRPIVIDAVDEHIFFKN